MTRATRIEHNAEIQRQSKHVAFLTEAVINMSESSPNAGTQAAEAGGVRSGLQAKLHDMHSEGDADNDGVAKNMTVRAYTWQGMASS